MRTALAPHRLVAVALATVLVSLGISAVASAGFDAATSATATVRAAADWTPPAVALASPGSSVKDTVTLTVSASDAEAGIREVVVEHLPPGGPSWSTLCTDSTAPYTCGWDTRATADGSHALRARATDNTGLSSVSETVTTTVANSLLVVLGDPGAVVRGTVTLPVTLHNPGLLTWSVRVEYAVAGTNSWKSLCPSVALTSSCTWNTTSFANDYVDLRAVATSGLTTHYSAVITDVLVDNLAPVVTMTDPGTPLRGTVTLAATASDAHSGVAQVVIQRAPQGTTAWTATCTLTSVPWSCRFDTTQVTDGSWSFRAVATDAAGNATTSPAVGNRVVDNTVSSVSLEDPGAYLTGTVALTSSASSTAGVTRVSVQHTPAGTASWTDTCSATGTPYSCSWDTTTVADGPYDLRAVLTDGTGKVTVSGVVAARRVDNSPLRGVDVQAVNGGATAGRLDAGDVVTFTWNRPVNLGTVSPGWTGAATAVSLRLRDGNLLALGNKGDTFDVQRAGSTVNLGSVNLRQELIKTNKTAVLSATMTAATVMVDGSSRTTVTLHLGGVTSGAADLRTTTMAAAMVWTPSGSVLDDLGRASSTAPVTETGTADKDF